MEKIMDLLKFNIQGELTRRGGGIPQPSGRCMVCSGPVATPWVGAALSVHGV
jgi:hypothetical protein